MLRLIMDDETIEQIAKIVQWAKKHPMRKGVITHMILGSKEAKPDAEHHCITIPSDFNCTFTYEYLEIGLCAHLSVSRDHDDQITDNHLERLMFSFKMCSRLQEADQVYEEDFANGKTAIHVVKRVATATIPAPTNGPMKRQTRIRKRR